MILRLETGDDKISFVTGNIFLAEEFQPKTPDIDLSGINWISPNSDNLDYKDVTEVISVNVRGIDMADMYRSVSELDRFVSKIRTKVTYLMYRPKKNDSDTIWRSRVKSVLTTRSSPIYDGQYGFYMRIDIAVTRYPYWEGDLTDAPVYNQIDNFSVPNVDVYNNSSTGILTGVTRYNWMYIGADGSLDSSPEEIERIQGDVPTPLYLYIQNAVSATPINDIYISLNTISDIPIASHPHIFETEGATYVVANVNDSGVSSGDRYGRVNVNTTLITSMQKTLSGSLLSKLNGNYFRVMLFFKTVPLANTTAKVYIKSGVVILSETNNVILNSAYIQEIGSLRLPPFISDYSNLNDLTFDLSLANTSGSYVSDLDCVCLMPLNGWRKMERLNGDGVEPGDALVDDEIENELYVSGTTRRMDYRSYGDKIMIYPHHINQLFIMFNDVIDIHNPYEYVKVSVKYRPRKITL